MFFLLHWTVSGAGAKKGERRARHVESQHSAAPCSTVQYAKVGWPDTKQAWAPTLGRAPPLRSKMVWARPQSSFHTAMWRTTASAATPGTMSGSPYLPLLSERSTTIWSLHSGLALGIAEWRHGFSNNYIFRNNWSNDNRCPLLIALKRVDSDLAGRAADVHLRNQARDPRPQAVRRADVGRCCRLVLSPTDWG
jgi:hypothetical protein